MWRGLSRPYVNFSARPLDNALEIDPGNVAAMVCLAGANTAMAASYLADDRTVHLGGAQTRLEKALSLEPGSVLRPAP